MATIFIVEDNEVNLSLYKHTLSEFGDILPYTNPVDALTCLCHNEPDVDVFVLDVVMPIINGHELCDEIRSLPKYKYTPIIMSTILNDIEHVEETVECQANAHIDKADMEQLKELVRQYLT